MAKDVSIEFAGDLRELKQTLEAQKSYIEGWGSAIKGIGVAAFTGWIGHELLDGLKELVAAGREWIVNATSEQDIQAIAATLIEQARKGDIRAIDSLLDRLLGKAAPADLQERVERLEAALEAQGKRL
jgi:hypothetical protein